jgi:hypothetical protein
MSELGLNSTRVLEILGKAEIKKGSNVVDNRMLKEDREWS